MASALALSFAIEKTFGISPELKWPNDLTVGGKKIAGMLVDVSMESNRIESLVLGVGINFDIDAKQVEKALRSTPNFYGAESLEGRKRNVRPIRLVRHFLVEMERIYKMLNKRQTGRIVSEWTKRSSTIGRKVEVDTAGDRIRGKATKIDGEGALLVLGGSKVSRVIAGDVVHLT